MGIDAAALLAILPDALLVVDASGAIRHASQAVTAVFGYQPAELVGQNIDLLVPDSVRGGHAARRAAFHAEPSARQMRAGRTLFGVDKDGRSIPLLVSLAPIGELVVAIARPLPTPAVLELNDRLTRAAVAAAANGIVITDRAGVIVHVNEAVTRLTGYAADELLGKSPRVLRSGRHDATFYRAMWDTVLAGRVWTGEIINRRKDGSTYIEEQTITPVADDHGAITHFVAIKQDVTRRRADEVALRQRLDELTLLHELALLAVSTPPRAELVARTEAVVTRRIGLSRLRVDVDAAGPEITGETAADGLDVVVLLRVGDEVLGTMTATFPSGATVGEHQRLLLDTVASQLALALRSAALVERLEQRAHTDALTGLDNRHRFFERAQIEVERARRHDRPLSLVMIDLDHFKAINDDFGHAHGDAVLCRVAAVLRGTCRISDVVARLGGEELVLLLPETSSDGALLLIERARQELAQGRARGLPSCTFSAGIAAADGGGGGLDELLRAADRALYEAKAAGRDTARVSAPRRAASRPG